MSKKRITCHHCSKLEYIKKECWNHKKENKKEKDEKEDKEATIVASSDDVTIISSCENTCLGFTCDADWVIDTGVLFHCTP